MFETTQNKAKSVQKHAPNDELEPNHAKSLNSCLIEADRREPELITSEPCEAKPTNCIRALQAVMSRLRLSTY